MTPPTTTPAPDPPSHQARRSSWLRRWSARVFVALLLALLGAELVARFGLGLGDPPLSVADPEIEYLFRPSRTYRRFGNTIHYNAYSMRSDDFPAVRADENERRVMVLGDSVINGGSLTDQRELATALLKRRLSDALGVPVVVGNISAGSWGPANLLAYVKRSGLFDADVVVIVLSSHDCADVPGVAPVVGADPNFPARSPVLALEELFTRYLPRYLSSSGAPATPAHVRDTPPDAADLKQSDAALRELIGRAGASGAAVLIAQHLTRKELASTPRFGHGHLAELVRGLGLDPVSLAPAFRAAIDAGEQPYRDVIHPSPAGQRAIAEALFEPIRTLLIDSN